MIAAAKYLHLLCRSCSCDAAPRDISEIVMTIIANIRINFKITTKLSLPALLGARHLHLIGSSQELSHTEKHSTGKTRKCEKILS